MRILVLDEEFTWPLNTGKRLRSFNLFSRLAKKHEMRYIGYGTESSEAWSALHKESMHPVAVRPRIPPKSGPLFYLRLLRNLFSSQPYIVQSLLSRDYASEVQRQMRDFQPDVVVSEGIFYGIYFDTAWNCNKLVSTHNIESDIWRRYVENERNPFKRAYISLQRKKVSRFEERVMRIADSAIAVSNTDASRLSAMTTGARIETIDNGVDLEFFSTDKSERSSGAPYIIFTGSMDWRPNQDAVDYFANEILPLLRQRWLERQLRWDAQGGGQSRW